MHEHIQYVALSLVSPDTDTDPYSFSQGKKNALGVISYADNISICMHSPTTRDTGLPWEARLKDTGQELEDGRRGGAE